VFYTEKHLAEVTGKPVLTSIGRTWLDRHRLQRRSELLRFSAVTAGLVMAFGLLQVLQRLGAL
jgi:hypothetical protein